MRHRGTPAGEGGEKGVCHVCVCVDGVEGGAGEGEGEGEGEYMNNLFIYLFIISGGGGR